MPRKPREHHPEAIYHVVSRGVEKRDIFLRDADRVAFLSFLRDANHRHGVSLLSYCLMNNHFHLLLAISQDPLELSMQSLLTRYSIYFNHTHKRVGHLFQSRYFANSCEDLGYLIQLTVYIHRNPVRAGLVAAPSDWTWSSHDEFVNLGGPNLQLDRLAELTGMSAAQLRDSYLERIGVAPEPQPRPRPTLHELIEWAAGASGVSPKELKAGKRGGLYTKARRLLAEAGPKEGYSDSELAAAVGCTKAALCHLRAKSIRGA